MIQPPSSSVRCRLGQVVFVGLSNMAKPLPNASDGGRPVQALFNFSKNGGLNACHKKRTKFG